MLEFCFVSTINIAVDYTDPKPFDIIRALTIFSPFIIAFLGIIFNYQLLRHDKKLSTRILLTYDTVQSCGFKLESLANKNNIRILETPYYKDQLELYKSQIDITNNMSEKFEKFKEYLQASSFLRISNFGHDCVHSLFIEITYKIKIGTTTSESINIISIPTLVVGESCFILLGTPLNDISKDISISDALIEVNQTLHKTKITYLTQFNEKLILDLSFDNDFVNTKYFSKSTLVRKNLLAYKMPRSITWIFPGQRLKSSDLFESIYIK